MPPPNRIVALATPLVAPLAGAFAAWFTQEVPGFGIPEAAIEETFLAVTGLVLALALQFNHNRFKWDVLVAPEAGVVGPMPVVDDDPPPVDEDDLDYDYEDETFDLMGHLDAEPYDAAYRDPGDGVLLEGEDEAGSGNGHADLPPVR